MILRLIAILIASSIGATAIADGNPPTRDLGRWLTESGNLEVNIEPCGDALCGTVVKVLGNRSMSDPHKQMSESAEQVLGRKILTDFKPTGESAWKGHIFNRENGKTYDCRMTLLSPEQMEIRAYKFLPIFGKTQIWKRVEQ